MCFCRQRWDCKQTDSSVRNNSAILKCEHLQGWEISHFGDPRSCHLSGHVRLHMSRINVPHGGLRSHAKDEAHVHTSILILTERLCLYLTWLHVSPFVRCEQRLQKWKVHLFSCFFFFNDNVTDSSWSSWGKSQSVWDFFWLLMKVATLRSHLRPCANISHTAIWLIWGQ